MSASTSLWPSLTGQAASQKGMREMLHDAAGDIGTQTGGKLEFHVDVVGVGEVRRQGAIRDIRHNCYLRVPRNNYSHLLFRVTTPVASPFPADVVTPEGEAYRDLADEPALRNALEKVLGRERTKDIVLYLLNAVA